MAGERGTWRQIGATGVWVDTVLAGVAGGLVVTVDKLGDLWATDPRTQESRKVNEEKYTHSRFLFGAGAEVYTIDQDGSLWATDVAAGTWRRLNDAGAFRDTVMGAMAGNELVTIETNGAIYATAPSGACRRVSTDNYSRTQLIFSGTTRFFTLENNNLYAVDPANGSCRQLGGPGDFANTRLGAGMDDRVYTLEGTGFIWETDGATGVFRKLSPETFLGTRTMFAGNRCLYTIEPTGCLYEIGT